MLVLVSQTKITQSQTIQKKQTYRNSTYQIQKRTSFLFSQSQLDRYEISFFFPKENRLLTDKKNNHRCIFKFVFKSEKMRQTNNLFHFDYFIFVSVERFSN
jgi:hypothetical protein